MKPIPIGLGATLEAEASDVRVALGYRTPDRRVWLYLKIRTAKRFLAQLQEAIEEAEKNNT